jgi:hypothetical protein
VQQTEIEELATIGKGVYRRNSIAARQLDVNRRSQKTFTLFVISVRVSYQPISNQQIQRLKVIESYPS